MSERDENVARRYRALGNEEPPPELDRRILAAAREAVTPRRASQRWAVPASLAAVLVLALGITLRMQMEKPGIEVSAPASEYSSPSAAPPEAPVDKATAVPAPPAAAPSPVPPKTLPAQADSRRSEAKRSEPPPPAGAAVDAMAMPERRQARPLERPEPQAFADRAAAAAPAAPPPQAAQSVPTAPAELRGAPAAPALARAPAAKADARDDTAAASAETPARSKREALGATAQQKLAKENVGDPRERQLARIAELRREGRHGEADEALKKFRAEHPDYRIPEAVWEQVRPR